MATPIQTTTLNFGIDQKEKTKQQQTLFLNKQNKPLLKPAVFILMYSFVF
jgi:hypothetical protein